MFAIWFTTALHSESTVSSICSAQCSCSCRRSWTGSCPSCSESSWLAVASSLCCYGPRIWCSFGRWTCLFLSFLFWRGHRGRGRRRRRGCWWRHLLAWDGASRRPFHPSTRLSLADDRHLFGSDDHRSLRLTTGACHYEHCRSQYHFIRHRHPFVVCSPTWTRDSLDHEVDSDCGDLPGGPWSWRENHRWSTTAAAVDTSSASKFQHSRSALPLRNSSNWWRDCRFGRVSCCCCYCSSCSAYWILHSHLKWVCCYWLHLCSFNGTRPEHWSRGY